MLIDCDTCRAPDGACADCVIPLLLDRQRIPVELDDAEQHAIDVLADAGLVPPVRLVPVPAMSRTSGIGREIA